MVRLGVLLTKMDLIKEFCVGNKELTAWITWEVIFFMRKMWGLKCSKFEEHMCQMGSTRNTNAPSTRCPNLFPLYNCRSNVVPYTGRPRWLVQPRIRKESYLKKLNDWLKTLKICWGWTNLNPMACSVQKKYCPVKNLGGIVWKMRFCHPEFFGEMFQFEELICFRWGKKKSPPKIHSLRVQTDSPLLFQEAQMGGLTMNQKRNNS